MIPQCSAAYLIKMYIVHQKEVYVRRTNFHAGAPTFDFCVVEEITDDVVYQMLMFAAMSLEVGVIPQAPPVTGDTRQGSVEDKTGNAVFGNFIHGIGPKMVEIRAREHQDFGISLFELVKRLRLIE